MTMYNDIERNWWDERVESFVDGELGPDESARFEAMALLDAGLGHELETAWEISSILHGVPVPRCPDPVTDRIMATVRRDLRQSALHRITDWLANLPIPSMKPVVAMAILMAIVVSSALVGRQAGQSGEVDQALSDVKWTLAYLSDFGRDTGFSLRTDVIEPHVAGSMRRGVTSIMNN